MSDLLDFYMAEGQRLTVDLPQISALRTSALADFSRLGFPTRHDEDWKYTATDAFIKHRYHALPGAKNASDRHKNDLPIAVIKQLPPGVIVLSWAEALVLHAAKIKPYLGQIATHTHGFLAQNTAMLRDGLFIYLPQGVCLDEPLLLSHWQETAYQASYIRTLIVAESGSQATVIEDYQGDANTPYFTNTLTEVHLGAGAHLKHYKIQRESPLAYHVGELAVRQTQSSQLDSHSLSLGGKWVRSDTTITLAEPHASCLMNGIYATAGDQHVDHHTVVKHDVPDCTSDQDYKGMVTGHSRAVFNGKVVVAVDAQHTEAKQQNKNLLLSSHAEIDTKPQLEIFADDVVCTHGATVGQLDEEALFYLGTRGIPPLEASRYLVQAFVTDNLNNMASEPLARWMGALLTQHLG